MTDTFDPRRAAPGARITYHDRIEGEVTLHADADGVIWPKSELEVSIADSHGLPVARKALAEKAAEQAVKSEKESKP